VTRTRVFDGRLLRAEAMGALSGAVLVTFDSRSKRRPKGEFAPAVFSKTLAKKNIGQLRIQTTQNDWFANAETKALENALAAYVRPFSSVHLFGFSMGGFAAFRFARALKATSIVAVSPLWGIWGDVSAFDQRYAVDLPLTIPQEGDLTPHGNNALTGVIAVDPMMSSDMEHARRLQAHFPQIALARMPFGGHPAGKVIREVGAFGALRREALSSAPQAARLIACTVSAQKIAGLGGSRVDCPPESS